MDYRPPLKPTTKREAIKAIDAECMDIMARKNRDYGNDNIGRFGLMGIVVRLNDKLERLIQLTDPCRQGGPAVKDESIRDTMLDARNYAEIALLFMDGNWGLPWEGDATGGIVKNPTLAHLNNDLVVPWATVNKMKELLERGGFKTAEETYPDKPPVPSDPTAPCPLARDGKHDWKIDGHTNVQHCLNCKQVRENFCPPHNWKSFDGVEVCCICGVYKSQCEHRTWWQTDHGTYRCEDCGEEVSCIDMWDTRGPCEYEPGVGR